MHQFAEALHRFAGCLKWIPVGDGPLLPGDVAANGLRRPSGHAACAVSLLDGRGHWPSPRSSASRGGVGSRIRVFTYLHAHVVSHPHGFGPSVAVRCRGGSVARCVVRE